MSDHLDDQDAALVDNRELRAQLAPRLKLKDFVGAASSLAIMSQFIPQPVREMASTSEERQGGAPSIRERHLLFGTKPAMCIQCKARPCRRRGGVGSSRQLKHRPLERRSRSGVGSGSHLRRRTLDHEPLQGALRKPAEKQSSSGCSSCYCGGCQKLANQKSGTSCERQFLAPLKKLIMSSSSLLRPLEAVCSCLGS